MDVANCKVDLLGSAGKLIFELQFFIGRPVFLHHKICWRKLLKPDQLFVIGVMSIKLLPGERLVEQCSRRFH